MHYSLIFQFICPPLEVENLLKRFLMDYKELDILSADVQYLAKSLVSISDDMMIKNDKLISVLTDHPDVLTVYDNIKDYPSKTIKLVSDYD